MSLVLKADCGENKLSMGGTRPVNNFARNKNRIGKKTKRDYSNQD